MQMLCLKEIYSFFAACGFLLLLRKGYQIKITVHSKLSIMTSPKWRHNWYFWSFITS